MKYTTEEFCELSALLLPFGAAFPEMWIHFDRLKFYLKIKCINFRQTFDTFHRSENERRSFRQVRTFHWDELAFLLLPLGNALRNISCRFPDLAIHADRVFFEILNGLRPMESDFQTFHAFAEEMRHTTKQISTGNNISRV